MKNNKKYEYLFDEVPVGLSFALTFNQDAFYAFGVLDEEQKRKIIRYIKDSKTGEEGEKRTYEIVSRLQMGDKNF